MRRLGELIAGVIASGPVSLQQEPIEEPGFPRCRSRQGAILRACCPNGRAGFRACRLRSFPTSRTKADSLTRKPGTGKSPEPADRNVCPTSEAEIDLGNTPLTLPPFSPSPPPRERGARRGGAFLNSNPLSPALSPLWRGEGVGGGGKLRPSPGMQAPASCFFPNLCHSEQDKI
jgi:hypothetical protein